MRFDILYIEIGQKKKLFDGTDRIPKDKKQKLEQILHAKVKINWKRFIVQR